MIIDADDKEKLILEWVPLAYWVAHRVAARTNHYEDIEDVKQIAVIAMMEAMDTYEDGHGATMRTWCVRTIDHRILDYLRKEMLDNGGRGAPRGQWRATRVDDILLISDESDSSFTQFVGYDEPGYEELESFLTESKTLDEFLKWVEPRLTYKEFFALELWMTGMLQKDVGGRLKVTESRICQMLNKSKQLAKEFGEIKGLR